jgi:hypothetical protein
MISQSAVCHSVAGQPCLRKDHLGMRGIGYSATMSSALVGNTTDFLGCIGLRLMAM